MDVPAGVPSLATWFQQADALLVTQFDGEHVAVFCPNIEDAPRITPAELNLSRERKSA